MSAHTTQAHAESVGRNPVPAHERQVESGLHPGIAWIAVISAVWFLAMAWMSFARNGEVDYLLVIVSLFFGIFFVLFLRLASFSLHDPRWPSDDMNFRKFLNSRVSIATGEVTGREALFEAALVPVALALAATLIGIMWIAFG